MKAQEAKDRAQQVFDAFSAGDPDRLDPLFAADYVERATVPPGWPPGLEGLKAFVRAIHEGFPDFRYTVEDMIAEGDRVVGRATASGTHEGDFLGIPATGKHATWSEIHIGRLVDGRFVEHWAIVDQLGLMQQLGAIPAPDQAPA